MNKYEKELRKAQQYENNTSLICEILEEACDCIEMMCSDDEAFDNAYIHIARALEIIRELDYDANITIGELIERITEGGDE